MVSTSIRLIRLWRRLAPARLRGACRFDPSCSEYAERALRKHGFMRGWKRALGRILRCRPPNGGVDLP